MSDVWEKRFLRERQIRKEAERLLEEKTLDVYLLNKNLEKKIQEATQELKELNASLESRVLEATEELRQNNEELQSIVDFVNEQKSIIERKNETIKKSIEAAFRIQKAILPTTKEVSSILEESFLINIPRDVVSGDFLWLFESEERKIIVVADCTGHGVPGAFMSVIGHALLNKIVIDNNIFLPDHILYYLNQWLVDFLRRSQNTLHEGMDVSVCVYHKATKKLKFSGAMNSMFYTQNQIVTEIKGDKKCIGGKQVIHEERTFTSFEIQIQQPTMIYLCSDGFQDQFGGINNKKFLKKRLKELMESSSESPVNVQKEIFLQHFYNWKGEYDQIDDVLLFGFKLQ